MKQPNDRPSQRRAKRVKDLEAENAELRARLAEAEEKLRATRGGEVSKLIQQLQEQRDAWRVSEEKYRNLVKYAPAVIYEIDLAGTRFLSVNEVMCDILGYSKEELLSMKPGDLLDEESKSLFAERIRKKLAGDTVDESVEYRIKRKDGAWIYAAVTVSAFSYTSSDESPRVAVVAYDVTARRQMEEALRKNEAILRGILNAARESIWLFSLDGIILLGNETAFSRLRRPAEEVVGEHFSRFMTEELARARQTCLNQVIETGRPAEHVDERSGITFHHHFYPVKDDTGRVVQIVAFSSDITERKQAEEALFESEERLRALYVSMTEGLAIHEILYADGEAVDYLISDVNPAFESITGIARSEAVGRKASELYGTGRPPYLDVYARVASSGAPEAFETYFPPMEKHLAISAFSPEKGRFATVFNDITERRRIEDALRESRRKYRDLIETIGDFIWEMDDQARYTYCSPHMEKLWGIKPEEMLGKTPFDIMPPEEKEKALEYFRAIADSPAPFAGLTTTAYNSQGEVIFAETSGVPFFNRDGRLLGFRGTSRDVTERKLADQALRENEEWLRLAFDAGDLGRWRYSVTTYKVHFDERARVQFGLFDNSVTLARALECVHPDDRTRLQQEIASTLNPIGPGRYAGEYRICWPDGETRWLAVQARVQFEGEGEARHPILVVGISQDITARKQTELALAESRARLNFALEKSGTGGWDLDLVDHTAFRTLEHDRIFGYEALLPQWTYEMFLEHVIPEDRAEVDRRFQAAITAQTDWNFECRIRRADGEVRWIWAVGGHRYDDGHQAYRMAGIVQDITERKRAEEALRESEQRFRLALRNAPVSVAAQDRDLRFLWAYNQRTVDPRSVIGKTDSDLFPPEDAARLIALKRAVLETNTERHEQLWLTSGGQRVFIDLHLEPMRDASGQVTSIGIATVDLTQMKLVEEALRQVRNDLDRAQEVGQIGSWRLDVRHDVLTWSDENHRIFGVPPGTLLTYEIFLGCVHPEDREYVDRQWTAGLAGEPYDIEHRIIVEGVVKWVREKAYLEFDQDRTLLGGFGITQDITERKRAEEAMAWLASFPQFNPNPVTEVDLAGHLYYLNPAAKRLLPDLAELGFRHPWLVELESLGKQLQLNGTQVVTREVAVGEAAYQQTLHFVSSYQRIRIYGHEITKRKLMEKALKASEEKYKAIVEDQSELIARYKPDGTWTFVNDAYCKYFGESREELLGSNFASRLTDEERKFLLKDLPQLTPDHPSATVELWMTFKGEPRFLRWTNRTIFDEGGRIIEFQSVGQDITERRRMEEALRRAHDELEARVADRTHELAQANLVLAAEVLERRRAEAQVRVRTMAMEAAANGIIITNRAGVIEWCNPALARMTGYTAEEVIGQNPRLLRSGQHSREFYQELWSTIESGQTWRGELVNRRKDGSLYFEEQTITPVQGEQDTITHFIAIKQDITERKRAENAIRQNAARAEALAEVSRAIVEASLDYQTVLDAVAHGASRMVGGVCVIHLLSEDEQWLNLATVHHADPGIARAVLQLLAARPFSVHENLVAQLIGAGQPLLMPSMPTAQLHDLFGLNVDALLESATAISLASMPLRLNGKLIGAVTVWRDQPGPLLTADDQLALEWLADRAALAIGNAQLHTDLQQSLEKEQNTRQQLVQAETFAALGRIVAAVAHELNNPLQTIRNCLFLIQQEIQPDGLMHEYFQMAAGEFERLTSLVAQLRALQRSRVTTAMQPLDLCALIVDVHRLLEAELTAHRIRWHSSIETSRCTIVGTFDQLKQVCLNIGLNAVEAMQADGGALSVDLIASDTGEQVGVRFRDTGHGIKPESLDKLFEPLYTTKPSGLGLGLPICYEIVQRHNGHITVESEPGHGATFTVWLPLADHG